MNLADLLAPVTPATFFAEYHDKQPLHVKGGAAKFASVLGWRGINRLLDMTHIWSSQSLKLFLDGKPIEPSQYCASAVTREGGQGQQPDAGRVAEWVAKGASIVMCEAPANSDSLSAAPCHPSHRTPG